MNINTLRHFGATATGILGSIALAGCTTLQGMMSDTNTVDTSTESSTPSTSLLISYDPNALGGGNPCSDSFCQFFSVEITNNGTAPVDFYDDICLVADGITYAENFGVTLSGTLNPGSTSGFDAAFRPASGASVTELYVGSCTSGTKLASLKINYTS